MKNLILLILVAGACSAEDKPESDVQLQKITEARDETFKRVGDLQDYKPTQEELTANAIRVEKQVKISKKTGKIQMVMYRTFRGDRWIKDYTEFDSDNDGELDYFWEVFRVDSKVCVVLTRRTSGPSCGSSMHVAGLPHVSVEFMGKHSDGKFDELLLMHDDDQFFEHYRRDSDGLMQPVSAEDYLATKHGFSAISPLTGAIMGLIKDKGTEVVPNKSAEPARDKDHASP